MVNGPTAGGAGNFDQAIVEIMKEQSQHDAFALSRR